MLHLVNRCVKTLDRDLSDVPRLNEACICLAYVLLSCFPFAHPLFAGAVLGRVLSLDTEGCPIVGPIVGLSVRPNAFFFPSGNDH